MKYLSLPFLAGTLVALWLGNASFFEGLSQVANPILPLPIVGLAVTVLFLCTSMEMGDMPAWTMFLTGIAACFYVGAITYLGSDGTVLTPVIFVLKSFVALAVIPLVSTFTSIFVLAVIGSVVFGDGDALLSLQEESGSDDRFRAAAA